MQVTIKLEGVDDCHKFFKEYSMKVIPAAEIGIRKGMQLIAVAAINNIGKGGDFPGSLTGELKSLIKFKIDGKGKTFVVGHIGTLGATKRQCIIANSVEYGHALPGEGIDVIREQRKGIRRRKGVRASDLVKKKVKPYPFIRPALDETKSKVKAIVGAELERAIRGK